MRQCKSPIGGDDGTILQCVERGHCDCKERKCDNCPECGYPFELAWRGGCMPGYHEATTKN